MATAVAPPVTPKTSTSVDPLYTAAIAQAKAALAGETAPIKAEQTASDSAFKQQETDSTGVAAALSKLLTPIGPAVNAEYQTAGQNQELAANGFSAGMKDALQGNTDNLNEMLQKLGQPVTLDSHATQAGDVLYGLGGYSPGTAFSKEGAAFGAAADLQSGDAILKGQENVKALQAKATVADQGFQAKIAELAGKLPGDIQTNYAKLQQLSLENAKFREQVAKDKSDAAFKLASQKLAVAKYNTGIAEFNSRQQLSYTKLARQEFQQNRMYAISLAHLGIAQRSAQIKAATAAFKAANGGYSPKELSKLQVEATGLAHSYFDGSSSTKTYASTSNVTGKGSTSKGVVNTQRASNSVTQGITYSAALTKLMQKGIPVQVAIHALNSVYPVGQQLNAAGLDNYLGPLSPANIAARAAVLNAKGGVALQTAQDAGPQLMSPTHAGGFLPTNTQFTLQRADQGRDIQTTPGAPILAPGAGYVVRIASDPGGGGAHFGPQYPIVHFTSGPYAGQTMYIGHTVSAMQAGEHFGPGSVLSHTGQQSGALNGGAPAGWAEIGFAPNGVPGHFGQQPPF